MMRRTLVTLVVVALALASARAQDGSEPVASHVWLFDGSEETYLGFAFMPPRSEPILAIDPDDPDTWRKVVPYVRHRYLRREHRPDVAMVGRTSPALTGFLLDLQNEGRARVSFEPDPWRLVKRELAGRSGEIHPLWVAEPRMLGDAVHAASVRQSQDVSFVPTADPERLA